MNKETFKEGEKVWAFVDEINEWVKGTFMFYYNKRGAYVRLDKIILRLFQGNFIQVNQ